MVSAADQCARLLHEWPHLRDECCDPTRNGDRPVSRVAEQPLLYRCDATQLDRASLRAGHREFATECAPVGERHAASLQRSRRGSAGYGIRREQRGVRVRPHAATNRCGDVHDASSRREPQAVELELQRSEQSLVGRGSKRQSRQPHPLCRRRCRLVRTGELDHRIGAWRYGSFLGEQKLHRRPGLDGRVSLCRGSR